MLIRPAILLLPEPASAGSKPPEATTSAGSNQPEAMRGRCLDVVCRIRAKGYDAVQVRSIDGALATAEAFVVAGDLEPGMVDADLPAINRHADLGANQLPRHTVMVVVDAHAGVVLHTPGQLAQLMERRTADQRTQGLPLIALEPRDRRLARRAVHPRVGHLAHPPGQMCLQRSHDAKRRPAMALCLT